jgi:hypothetical protein
MLKKWKYVRDVGEKLTLNVSGAGSGLYLHLPKDLCNTYGIIAGDRMKVTLTDLFKRYYKTEEETEKRGVKKRKSSSEF